MLVMKLSITQKSMTRIFDPRTWDDLETGGPVTLHQPGLHSDSTGPCVKNKIKLTVITTKII